MKRQVSSAQMALGRAMESKGITTISQFVKACERGEFARIDAWKKQLQEVA
jgi:hypothetical protein